MQSSLATLLAFLFAVTTTLASPLHARFSDHAIKDSHTVPPKWSEIGSASPDQIITLQIGLKQGNFPELERHLYEVSSPSHSRYGQHLSKEEVNKLVKPKDDTLELVHDWLSANGIEASSLSYTPAKDWITLSLPVRQIERLLDTKYSVFKHEDGDSLVRAPVWSLPACLHKHVDTIQPTNSFFRPQGLRKTLKPVEVANPAIPAGNEQLKEVTKAALAGCDFNLVTPACLRRLYGTLDYTLKVPGKNRIAITNYMQENSNIADVMQFLKLYRPDAFRNFTGSRAPFNQTFINGGDTQQTPDTPQQITTQKNMEGNLDAQTILGIGFPTPLTTYNVGFKQNEGNWVPDVQTPQNINEPYMTFLQSILTTDIPQVISSSYGDDEQTVPEAYARSVCNQFAQLGARGVSFFTASGDSGVGVQGDCITNDGKNTATFLAVFPATCPYVTAVGATTGYKPEIVALNPSNNFASGGGFSRYFAQPGFQGPSNASTNGSIVTNYVNGLKIEASLYNKAGRGYPDLAANGYHFQTIWNGNSRVLDGTSASVPATAAIFSLVNDALIAAGKSPMGFLNPWLYTQGHTTFTDITSGSAIGCGGDGFPAAKGWDAVSGWGTPNFPALMAKALKTAPNVGGGPPLPNRQLGPTGYGKRGWKKAGEQAYGSRV